MAITDKNKSLSGVKEILRTSSSSINAFETRAFAKKSQEEIIKEDIRALKAKEEELLKKFGGRAELQQRLSQFKKDAQNFTGRSLGKTFTFGFQAMTKKSTRELQMDFENYILRYLRQESGVEANKLTTKELFQVLNLKEMGIEDFRVIMNLDKGTVSSSKRGGGQVGYKINMKNKQLTEVLVSRLSRPVRARLRSLIDIFKKQEGIEQVKSNSPDVQAQGTTLIINPGIEWAKLISNNNGVPLSVEAAQKDPTIAKNLTNINMQIKQQIKSGLGITGEPASTAFDKVIEHMLRKQPYAFFVGRNANAVTGLIGEICAMILFYDLVKKFPSVEWAAQNTGLSGTQSSADIILYQGFGVQVKNTVKDLETYTRFKNQLKIGFSEINFDRLGSKLGFDGQSLQDLYDTIDYNASYTWGPSQKGSNAGTFKQGSNDNFDSTAEELENLKQQFEQIMMTYSSALLYMEDARNTGVNFFSQQGNVLYMVNLIPYYASDILQQILDSLTALDQQGAQSVISFSTANSSINKKIWEDINPNPRDFYGDTTSIALDTKSKFKTSFTF